MRPPGIRVLKLPAGAGPGGERGKLPGSSSNPSPELTGEQKSIPELSSSSLPAGHVKRRAREIEENHGRF